MVTNNSSNIVTASTGKILRGAGVGVAPTFSTATYPDVAGASGNILTSDGTDWSSAAAPVSGLVNPPNINNITLNGVTYRATSMQTLPTTAVSLGTFTMSSANIIYFYPVFFPYSASFTKIGLIVTSGAVSTNCRFALYNNSSGFPSTVLCESGSLDTSTNGVKETTGLSYSITAGWYWFGLYVDAPNAIFRKILTPQLSYAAAGVGASDISNATPRCSYSQSYGAFPTITQASLTMTDHANCPFFYLA